MSFSSTSSSDGIMAGRLRSLVAPPKPDIQISLNNSRTKTFTTLDKIEGSVSIIAPFDTPFTDFEIEFLGTSRAYVDRITTAAAVSGRSEAFHQFLKLTQPGMEARYPQDRVLKAGVTYDFPFQFAVPERILDTHCRHKITSATIHDLHVQLPPTLGDKDLEHNPNVPDDLAPDMASIRYGVFARLSLTKEQNDELKSTVLAARARRVRVLPATSERPPVSIDANDEFVLRKERKIKKSLLKGKLGSLVIETVQPPSMVLPSPRHSGDGAVSTMARINLRFDPTDDNSQPPKLGSLGSKLKVNTFFASSARKELPTKHQTFLDISQGVHTEALSLSSRCMANVDWTKHDPKKDAFRRRDSGYSTASSSSHDDGAMPEPSSTYTKGKPFYTAKIVVPIALPAGKTFVPTFHSCLISRTYSINLSLGVHNSGISGSMDLKVPVQISSQGNGDSPLSTRRSSVVSTAGASVDFGVEDDIADFFTPRRTSGFEPSQSSFAPSAGRPQVPNDAPPEYSTFATASLHSQFPRRTAFRIPVY